MSMSKAFFVSAATLGLATTACAQDAEMDTTYDTKTEVLDTVTVDHFVTSDINADGALDRAEYEAFVAAKSEAGDADAAELAEAGDYDVEFMTKDVNADGLLTEDELFVEVEDTPAMEEAPVIEDTDDMEIDESDWDDGSDDTMVDPDG